MCASGFYCPREPARIADDNPHSNRSYTGATSKNNRQVECLPPLLVEARIDIAFMKEERVIPVEFVKDRTTNGKTKNLSDYITKLAMIGGYLAGRSDPSPGNTVIWRGISRLVDIQLGFATRRKLVGN